MHKTRADQTRSRLARMGLALTLFCSGLLAAGCLAAPVANPPSQDGVEIGIQEGQRAPDFELKDLDDRAVKLSDYRGQVVLINFWATWCGPCRVEFLEIQPAYESNQKKGFVVLAVNVQDRRERVSTYAKELGLTFPILLDPLGKATGSYEARVLPTSYFVDQEGIIVLKKVGAIDRAMIDQVLAQTGAN